MKSLTFKRQLILGSVLIVVGNSIAFIFHKGIFSNIAWIIIGYLHALSFNLAYISEVMYRVSFSNQQL